MEQNKKKEKRREKALSKLEKKGTLELTKKQTPIFFYVAKKVLDHVLCESGKQSEKMMGEE